LLRNHDVTQSLNERLRGLYWIINGAIFTRLYAIIVLVPCCYEERRKILSSPAGRASEMNFITLGSPLENVRRARKPLSSLPAHLVLSS